MTNTKHINNYKYVSIYSHPIQDGGTYYENNTGHYYFEFHNYSEVGVNTWNYSKHVLENIKNTFRIMIKLYE